MTLRRLAERVRPLLDTIEDDGADWRARRNAVARLNALSIDMAKAIVLLPPIETTCTEEPQP